MKEIELLKIIFKDSPDIFKIINEIENQFQQKESIIKEAIEYMQIFVDFDECLINGKSFQKAIDILRGNDKE